MHFWKKLPLFSQMSSYMYTSDPDIARLPVISDLDHLGPGDFGLLSVISGGDFGRCAVKSDGDFGRCVMNSDAAVNSDGDFGRCAANSDALLSSLLYHYFGTDIANFGW